jgi:hypothetical protein
MRDSMEHHRPSSTTRWLTTLLGVTNMISFTIGVSLAGGSSGRAVERDVIAEPAATTRAIATPTHHAAPAARATPKPAPIHEVAPPPPAPPIPIAGKGMWIYQFDKVAGGDPARIVRLARQRGLSHIFVRAGSSISRLSGWKDIAAILPVAHAAGLKVIAWDFPYLLDPGADVRRARWVLNARVKGQKVDGFAADVETRSEGTVLTRSRARRYATWLRANAHGAFLILVPPRPNHFTTSFYPYDVLVPKFDAVAPMVYWGRQSPAEAAMWAVGYLKRFHKPIAPIGQAYDMGPYGGPNGAPSGKAVVAFMNQAAHDGAVGVSFWSWQHTPARLWHTIHTYHWPPR